MRSMTGWIVTTAIALLLPIWPTRNCCAEGREALDVLSQLLNLGSVYPFQREGGGNG